MVKKDFIIAPYLQLKIHMYTYIQGHPIVGFFFFRNVLELYPCVVISPGAFTSIVS